MAWPSTLPQSFEARDYQFTPGTGVITTDMDTGPAKVRRRFTAVSNYHSGSMVMTKTIYTTIFLPYFNTDLSQGITPFDFPDPISGATVSMRWSIPGKGRPFSTRQHSPDSVRVAFSLEELP